MILEKFDPKKEVSTEIDSWTRDLPPKRPCHNKVENGKVVKGKKRDDKAAVKKNGKK